LGPPSGGRPAKEDIAVTPLPDVFEKHHADYRARLANLDFQRIAPILGLEPRGDGRNRRGVTPDRYGTPEIPPQTL
jgi:hypothetical protein